ncbi:hypothetical protein [Paraburkholderia bannensis]|uniref:hypothetical protein n=1 Tax=Paraburkholderia bannensis TaxID=765414 RepID=UPI002ABE9F72|nr:hypothetical protein [Paraburkholderia bannensis]
MPLFTHLAHLTRSAAEARRAPHHLRAAVRLPARIVCAEGLVAQAVTRHGACALDLARTGTLPAGAWVLAAGSAAHAVIDARRAREIDAAIDVLDAIARGDLDAIHAHGSLTRYFAVLRRHIDITHPE